MSYEFGARRFRIAPVDLYFRPGDHFFGRC